ncbi:3-mercaptopyruvate sulfurtransferase [beta proteobacterium AAP99]|nr:3-mercaptopyruvate sulfurtransferase [beta proteobacterium AAP99]
MFQTLISAPALRKLLASGASVAVFDCRHDLMDVQLGRRQYAEGHIPGAQFAHLDDDLSAPKTGANGRHPLPVREKFAQWLGSRGVHNGMQVVVYDASGGMFAARLWWMCRWLGLEAVAVLDGGWPQWLAAGGDSTTAVPSPAPGHVQPAAPLVQAIDVAVVEANLLEPRFTLLDARAPERFRGEVEPIDPVAGHIPGSRNRFFKDNLEPDGRFKPADQLRRELQAVLGDTPAEQWVMSCGSGSTACHNVLAMELAGLGTPPMYAGSWSEWVADRTRPVAKG